MWEQQQLQQWEQEPAAKRPRIDGGGEGGYWDASQQMLQLGPLPPEKVSLIARILDDSGGGLPIDEVAATAGVSAAQLKNGDYPWGTMFAQSREWLALKDAPRMIQQAQQQALGMHGGCGAAQVAASPADAASFINAHPHVQRYAIDMFSSLTPEEQALVIQAGTLHGDQTTMLLRRCEVAKQKSAATQMPACGGGYQMMQYGGQDYGYQAVQQQQPQPQPQRQQQFNDWQCPGCGKTQFEKNAVCQKCGTRNPIHQVSEEWQAQVDKFLNSYPIEPHVVEQFRNLVPQLQELVLSKGSMVGVRDPTAVLVGRMRDARNGTLLSGASGAQPLPGDWYCPNCGDHQFQKNSQCRQCGTRKPITDVPDEWKQQVDMFLHENGIQSHAADKFRDLPQNLQKIVMDKGSMDEARDRTAVLLDRIRRVRKGELTADNLNPSPLPGDWYCPICNDLQFARNSMCRKCGSGNPTPTNIPVDVETFLGSYDIQSHAKDQFRNLAPNLQRMVMERGSLADARDPTAVLIRRMSDARHGKGEGKGPMPGDWFCPNCNDLQFKNNPSCRKCGTTNPSLLAGVPPAPPAMGGGGEASMMSGAGNVGLAGMASNMGMTSLASMLQPSDPQGCWQQW